MVSVVRQLRKPQSEIQKFHGDALLYRRVMRQFMSKIVANTEDDEECLNYLEQYTGGGEAYRIVSDYEYLEELTNVWNKSAWLHPCMNWTFNEINLITSAVL